LPPSNAELKALDVQRYPGPLFNVYQTLLADPSDVTLNNTRGSCSIMGNTVDIPKSMNFTWQAEIYDDPAITKYQKQSNSHISHTFNVAANLKLVKEYFDKIIWGGTNSYKVSDAIPEYPFQLELQSALEISTGVPYAFGIVALDAQFSGADPGMNTNQPVMQDINIKVVKQLNTGLERWYAYTDSLCTSDVFSAF
jgi:hypothetical protein